MVLRSVKGLSDFVIIIWVAGCETAILTCEKITVRNRHDSTSSKATPMTWLSYIIIK